MITAKSRTLLALLLLVCLLFCSCSSSPDNLDSLHSLTTPIDNEPVAATSEYDYVVLPANASDELIARARALTEALSAQTGIPASLYFDHEQILTRPSTRLLLIGNTSYALSQAHLHDLKRDDYLCRIDEGTLILGGKSHKATIAAMDRFCAEILPYADAELLLNADREFLVHAEYPVTALTLNGHSIGDYEIVYPKDTQNGERSVAHALREAIADRCGLYPAILSERDVTQTTRVITIGACLGIAPSNEAAVTVADSQIALHGSTEYALAAATEALYEHLLPEGKTGEIHLTLDTPIAVSDALHTVHAIPTLLAAPDVTHIPSLIANLGTALRSIQTSFAPLGRVSAQVMHYLSFSLSEYACQSVPLDHGDTLPLFYLESGLSLLSSSRRDTRQLLRFSVRDTDLTFAVLHGYADNGETAATYLREAIALCNENEPLFVAIITPDTLSPITAEDNPFYTCAAWESHGERMSFFLNLPTWMTTATVTPPATPGAPCIVSLPHPFLRQAWFDVF